jgi:hypothetical protein
VDRSPVAGCCGVSRSILRRNPEGGGQESMCARASLRIDNSLSDQRRCARQLKQLAKGMRGGLFVENAPTRRQIVTFLRRIKFFQSQRGNGPLAFMPTIARSVRLGSSAKIFFPSFLRSPLQQGEKDHKPLKSISFVENERLWPNSANTLYFPELVSLVSAPGIWLGDA